MVMRRAISRLPKAAPSTALRALPLSPRIQSAIHVQQRTFLTKLFGKKPTSTAVSPTPILDQDNLFHPLSSSPLAALQEKAQRIRTYALCPESLPDRVPVAFDCPDCGFPTHASKEMWEKGREQHQKYCARLREWNEDEHDLRSGRPMAEFEDMPGPQPYESTPSFTSWDTLFFTRGFKSINTDRSLRHVTKLLTYPMTIGAVLHQNGPFTRGGEARVTREGSRSFAALHSTLHLPPGSTAPPPKSEAEPPFRIFILGARAESSLPPTLWLQLTHLFPTTNFQLYFIGPEAIMPNLPQTQAAHAHSPAPAPHDGDVSTYGVPSRTINVSPSLSLITLQSTYSDVHAQFGPFDPYSDVFFSFSPGLGFPAQEPEVLGQGLVQAETTWNTTLQQILSTKCPVFFTAFSPADLQRDVNALAGLLPPASVIPQAQLPVEPPTDTAVLALEQEEREARLIEGVTDEYDVVLSPGANRFASEHWEIADWDPRVGVKTNWGVWGIRGKRYEVKKQDE